MRCEEPKSAPGEIDPMEIGPQEIGPQEIGSQETGSKDTSGGNSLLPEKFPGDVYEKEREVFEALIEYLRQARGFDFTGYKRQSLVRRVRRRMLMVNIKSFDEYREYIETHPEEFAGLFSTILINVTSFFRDCEAWDYLASELVPKIIASKERDEPIRIWSAGCATGEEAYTISMIMAEALGEEEFKRRVKVFATDVDEVALSHARLGSYTPKDIELIPHDIRDKYFRTAGRACVFRPDLRGPVIFGRHDLVQNAPISHLDLMICRNTLMYFNAETQTKVLGRFHFALNDTGFLFLGRAELLLTHTDLFTPVNLKCRIFMKPPNSHGKLLVASAENCSMANHGPRQIDPGTPPSGDGQPPSRGS